MPRSIHEQTGLRIWQNDLNGFVIARLHFTADPRKRSEDWIAASKRGMSSAQWQQEFDINYSAHQGERAFPEIISRRSEIVSREGPFIDGNWPMDLPMWGGFDYGAKNPSSFHVYTVVDGVTYAIWELYQPCKNIISFTDQLKSCPYWNQIRYIAHDPDMSNLKQRAVNGDVTSVRAQFETLGVTRLVKGNNDEASWLATMARHWTGTEVTFRILEICPHMIDEFEQATYITMSDKQLETQNYKEALVDRRNHSLDDCKYFMNSGVTRARSRPLTVPSLVAAYGWSGAARVRTPRFGELGI